jgi:hypothetical protein
VTKVWLDEAACFLITLGHTNVWQYGFAFFLTALEQGLKTNGIKKDKI